MADDRSPRQVTPRRGLRGRRADRRLPACGDDERCELVRRRCAHAWQEVLVGVHGERRVGVTEPFGYNLDRHTVGDEKPGVGVAKVMKTDPGELGSPDDAVEKLANRLGVEKHAVVLQNIQSSGPWGSPSLRRRRCQRSTPCMVDWSKSTQRRLVLVFTPNSTGRPPTHKVREIDTLRAARSRSVHLSPTISPRRTPVWAARWRAG
jgi:hypothetical protein